MTFTSVITSYSIHYTKLYDGIYCVRFMPSFEGTYSFLLQSNFSMQEYEGTFLVTKQEKNNHGLVRVHNTYHFASYNFV